MQVRLPRVLLVIFCKLFGEFFVTDSSIISTQIGQKTIPGGAQEAPKTVPERFQTHLANHFRILSPKSANRKHEIDPLWDHLGPAGDPKILENGEGDIFWAPQEGPRTVPNRFFDRRRCETYSNSIFDRFLDPSDPYETPRMAANLKVFRFANRGSKMTQN